MLLPLAAVTWKAGEGGWDDFREAITAPEAVAALKLTLVASLVVALVNAVMGTIIAWILVRDSFPGRRFVDSIIDLPFALPDDRRRPGAARALRPERADADRHRLLAHGDRRLAALRDAAVRRADRAAGPDRARPRDGGGGRVAGRRARRRSSAESSSRSCCPRSSRASRSPTRGRSASSAPSCSISGNLPFETEVASVYIFGRIESGDPRPPPLSPCCCSASRWPSCSASDSCAAESRGTRPPMRGRASAATGSACSGSATCSPSWRARRADLLADLRARLRTGMGRRHDAGRAPRPQADAHHRRDRRSGEHDLRHRLRARDRPPPDARDEPAQRARGPAARPFADCRRPRVPAPLRAERLVRHLARGARRPDRLRLARDDPRDDLRVAAVRRARGRARAARDRHRAGAGGGDARRVRAPDLPPHHAAGDPLGGRLRRRADDCAGARRVRRGQRHLRAGSSARPRR